MTKPVKELPSVAKSFLMICSKCGVERYHRVIAHASAVSAKVECEVCNKKSTFKVSGAPEKEPKLLKSGKLSKASPRIPTAEQMWLRLKDEAGESKVLPYSMSVTFKVKSVIEHPKFGVGFVTHVYPTRIDVSFKEESRSLVHNRK